MSKNLRVFFLSVLVVIFAVSSAFALDELKWGKAADGNEGNTDDVLYSQNKTLTFKKSGYLVLPNQFSNGTQIELDKIILESKATEVVLRLPDPYTNIAGEGMHGNWNISFDPAVKQKFTIVKHGGVNAAIILEGDFSEDVGKNYWEVPAGSTLDINAPVRATNNNNPFSLRAKVFGTLIFDTDSNIYGEGSLVPRGFHTDGTNVTQRSSFDIENGGRLTVKVHTALQRDLDVHVKDKGTLEIAMAGEHPLEGAVLMIDGAIEVNQNLEITDGTIKTGQVGVSSSADKTLTKTGNATLTIGSGIFNDIGDNLALRSPDLSIKRINVKAGTLYLKGTADYTQNVKKPNTFASMHKADVTFAVDSGATLMLATRSVEQNDADSKVKFDIAGNLILANHSVYALDLLQNDGLYKEIYPYEEYYRKDNAMRIDVGDASSSDKVSNNLAGVLLDVKATGSVTINEGFQAFNKVTGAGTITINNTSGDDMGGIIFVGGVKATDVPEVNFNDFAGTINGTNANVGLWSSHFTEGLFRNAKITADNLLLYGYGLNNTVLDIRESNEAKIQDGFNHIYLRSDRPGADNTNNDIKSTMLTIGKISFTGIERNTDKLQEDSPQYEIKSLKVDSTHVEERAGIVDTDGGWRIVDLKKVQLYANRDTDFNGKFSPLTNDGVGMYAIRLGVGYDAASNDKPMSIIYWNADGLVSSDGEAADVNNIFSVKVLEKANVIVYGKGTDNYSFGKNNSILVKQDGKLEFPSGAAVNGNLMLEGSSTSSADIGSWYEDAAAPNKEAYPREEYFAPYLPIDYNGDGSYDRLSEYWWSNDKVGCFTVLTTRLTKKSRRDNAGGEYAITVDGTLDLSSDKVANPNDPTVVYPGRVMVRVKPDLDILDASDQTVGELTNGGQRFKIVGKEGGKVTNDFIPVYNAIYGFRIPREKANTETTGGVIFELRRNVGQLLLKNWEFTEDGYGDEFGAPNGHNFKIHIYYDQIGKYVDEDLVLVTYFGDYQDGVERPYGFQENVIDEGKVWYAEGDTLDRDEANRPGRAYVSNDIQFTASFTTKSDDKIDRNGDIHTGCIELIGTSYQEIVKLPKIALAMTSNEAKEKLRNSEPVAPALYSQYIVPSYKQYTFAREGIVVPTTEKEESNVTPSYSGSSNIIAGKGNAEFIIPGMWKSSYTPVNAAPVFVDGGYVWNYRASPTDVYYIKDSNGHVVGITDLKVRVYTGYAIEENYEDYDADKFEISASDNPAGMLISVPAELLGTAKNFTQIRQISLIGTKVNGGGLLTTSPLTYTLYANIDSEGEKREELNLKYTEGEALKGEQRITDINPSDLGVTNVDDIHLVAYNLPNEISLDVANGGIIAYTATGAPKAGTYSILAYAGDNLASNTKYKLYTFTVEVVPAVKLAVNVSNLTVEAGKTGTITITVSGGASDDLRTFTITPIGTAPTEIFDKVSGISIFGNGSVTITVTAGQRPAAYNYVVSGGGLQKEFTVTVTAIPEPSVTIDNPAEGYDNQFEDAPADGYTYHAVFSATAENFGDNTPEVEFTFLPSNAASQLYAFNSTDIDEEGNARKLLVVEGIAKRAGDTEQTFRVTAKAGSYDAEPVESAFTVDADPYAEEVTYPNTTGITFMGDSNSNAVTTGYRAMLPTRTTATEDDVVLPLWLKPVFATDDDSVVIGVEFVGAPIGDLANGAKATVRIYAEYEPDEDEELDEDDDGYRYYGWDVVYAAKPKDLELTVNNFTVAVNATATTTATTANAMGAVTYSLSGDVPSWVTINGSTGLITATNPTVAGPYPITVIARDSRGVSGQATKTITITVTGSTPTAFAITANPTTVTFDSPTAAAKTVALNSNFVGATVTYTASVDKAGLSATVSGSTLTLKPSAAGTYTVTVTGTNGTNTATATVNVTVSESGSAFAITATPTTVTFDSPTAADQTVTLSSNREGTTYDATVNASGLGATVSGNTLTLSPLLAGSYTVTVTGTNGTDTATATVNVTVSESGSAFAITANPTTVTFDRPSAAAQTVTLSSNFLGATVTYTATVSPSTGLTATVSGSTLTLRPSAAGTYTVTVTGTNGTNTATATVNVTVRSATAVGSSGGGGCDAGFGALALVLAAPLFLRRRRS